MSGNENDVAVAVVAAATRTTLTSEEERSTTSRATTSSNNFAPSAAILKQQEKEEQRRTSGGGCCAACSGCCRAGMTKDVLVSIVLAHICFFAGLAFLIIQLALEPDNVVRRAVITEDGSNVGMWSCFICGVAFLVFCVLRACCTCLMVRGQRRNQGLRALQAKAGDAKTTDETALTGVSVASVTRKERERDVSMSRENFKIDNDEEYVGRKETTAIPLAISVSNADRPAFDAKKLAPMSTV